ncbi:hypothetical protein F4805DRAFT_259779 [Annulohypoxylon moriforme]|nr:hypothetical protein F4805DRAFT_259779 [Annulohypoxylon moriforme]
MAPTESGKSDGEVLYFAYGSNLSPTQMKDRCPSSPPIGLAYLPGWTWLINERGYANVVQDRTTVATTVTSTFTSIFQGLSWSDSKGTEEESSDNMKRNEISSGVYGVLYRLHPRDETNLDMHEGVPWAYEKRFLDATLLPGLTPTTTADTGYTDAHSQNTEKEETVRVLVYIDFKRVSSSAPRKEYVDRMNRGIDEAMEQWGLPKAYVDSVIRPFIPER